MSGRRGGAGGQRLWPCVILVRIQQGAIKGLPQRLSAPRDEAQALRQRRLHAGAALPLPGLDLVARQRAHQATVRVGFPASEDHGARAPEVRGGAWGGFVFMNIGPRCDIPRRVPRVPAGLHTQCAARGSVCVASHPEGAELQREGGLGGLHAGRLGLRREGQRRLQLIAYLDDQGIEIIGGGRADLDEHLTGTRARRGPVQSWTRLVKPPSTTRLTPVM